MITGSSVHNQRIERLWRDMHKSVTILFYKLFYFLKHHSLLDPLNERHLMGITICVCTTNQPLLQQFVNNWNNHPIRTACHKSPQQLFTAGCLLSALDFFHSADNFYGVDPGGPIPLTDQGVSVPRTSINFLDTTYSN